MNIFWNKLKKSTEKFFARKGVQVFFLTLIIHVLFVIVFHFVSIHFLNNTSDNISYHNYATQITELLKQGTYNLGDVYSRHWYPLFISLIYFIVGPSMMIGSLVNAVITAGSALFFFYILKEKGVSEKVSFWSSLIVMNLYASFMYHSSLLLKESWIIFLVLGILYTGVQIGRRNANRWIWFALFLGMFILLRNLRFFIGFAAAAGFFAEWILNADVSIRKKILQGIVMFLGVSMTAFLLTPASDNENVLFKSESIFTYAHINNLERVRNYSELANSAHHIEIFTKKQTVTESDSLDSHEEIKTSLSIKGLIHATINTLLGPFPWQLSPVFYMAALPDILFIYVIIAIITIATFKYFFILIKRVLPWLVSAMTILGGVAVGADNAGAIIRQRVSLVILLGLVAAVCIDWYLKRHERSQ